MYMDILQDESFPELIPRLPEDVAIECLTRLPYSDHRLTSLVCKRWHQLLQSQQFYHHRKLTARTHKLCCFIQAITPSPSPSDQLGIGKTQTNYGITLFDPLGDTWDRIDPVPKYPFGLPLFCQIASTDGKLFIIGGWNPLTWEAVKDVFMYEFTTQRWTQCADMPSTRSFFAVGAMEEGRIMIAGGHDEKKNALKSSWVFEIKKNEWTELAPMSEERDECEGMVIGSEFWVVSGYETQSQGRFKDSADVYSYSEKEGGGGGWKRVDGAWRASGCPRSCVGVGQNGKLKSWGESRRDLVGICGVDLDDRVVITGSGCRGTAHEVFVAEKMMSNNGGGGGGGGEIGDLRKIQVPHEFSGFVQSGCCLEI